ncbi:MAG TPA: DinB family protein [Phycisphaerales bacterium]|nr:DinB family protein [Phycisphaerales bacterium]HMP37362.1 DinB family protein [Phycisphaerales bacterium]
MNTTTSSIVPPGRQALSYAELLVKEIDPAKFAHMPVAGLNHPAFTIGHLAMYPDRALGILGRQDLARPKAGWDALFLAGCPCVEQDGRYPPKEEIVAHFVERTGAVLAVASEATEAQLAAPNPLEGRMRELFPTVGAVLAFVLIGHPMMHLGQVSAWRRVIGMPPAM